MSRIRLFARFAVAVLTAACLLGAASLVSTALAGQAPARPRGPVPVLAVAVEPDRFDAHPGDAMTMFVTVLNTGTVPVTDAMLMTSVDGIALEASTPDGCEARRIGRLEPGRRVRFGCAVQAPAAAFTVGATVTGRVAGGRSVRESASVVLGGAPARLAALVGVVGGPVRPGGVVALRVRVLNTGAVPVDHLSVRNTTFPGCSATDLGTVAPRAEVTYDCLGIAPQGDAPTAIVARADAGPADVRAISDTATVDVVHPALVVTAGPPRRRTEVTVTNVGDAPVAAVRTDAPEAPDCAGRSLGALAPGESARFRCSSAKGTITALGAAPGDADGPPPTGPVGGFGSWRVDPPGGPGGGLRSGVPRPSTEVAGALEATDASAALTLTQRLSAREAEPGAPLTVTIGVHNSGSTSLRRVVLRDSVFPRCDGRQVGPLRPGHRATITCAVSAPDDDVAHVAVAVAEPSAGAPVPAVSEPVSLDVLHPALTVTASAQPADPYPGEPVTWSLTVANTGDEPVRTVRLRSTIGDCADRLGTLWPGRPPRTVSCAVPAGDTSVTNVLTVSGRLPSGGELSEMAAATAFVREAGGPGGGADTQPPAPSPIGRDAPAPSPIERDAPAPSPTPAPVEAPAPSQSQSQGQGLPSPGAEPSPAPEPGQPLPTAGPSLSAAGVSEAGRRRSGQHRRR